jgi:glycosyltransferase involved in cell wall biosynthesis
MNKPARFSSGRHPAVLFVTYNFRPARTAGTVRIWNIAKYLARSGWTVTVLTPDPSLWSYVEHAEATEISLKLEGIRRLPTGHYWRWLGKGSLKRSQGTLAWFMGGLGRRILQRFGIDGSVGWIKAAERACSSLTPNDVDVILATGPPFSSFSLAQWLSQRLGRPYVLDYRDLWSRNLHHPAPAAIRKETSVLSRCAAVTTVSPSWGLVLDRHFGVGPKLHVVSNGYDPEDLEATEPYDFGHFAIVYTGSFWPPKRVISPVMAALRRLNESEHDRHQHWMFHYYGKHERHVWAEAERFGLTKKVLVHGDVPRSRVLAAVRGAGVAVVITSMADSATREDNGMVTGKIFEATGLGTPTLLIAPEESDANDVLRVTGLGRRFAGNDVDAISSFLGNLMRGQSIEPKDPAAYAWNNLISGLDTVLRGVVEAQ